MCQLVQYLVHVTTYGSVYTLVLLSLDRYLAVVYPVRSISLRTVPNAAVAIVLTWLVVGTSCVPLLFAFDTVDLPLGNNMTRTVCTFDSANRDEKTYQALFFVTSLAVPLGAVTWLYLALLLRLWKGAKSPPSGNATANTSDRRTSRQAVANGHEAKKVTKKVLLIATISPHLKAISGAQQRHETESNSHGRRRYRRIRHLLDATSSGHALEEIQLVRHQLE